MTDWKQGDLAAYVYGLPAPDAARLVLTSPDYMPRECPLCGQTPVISDIKGMWQAECCCLMQMGKDKEDLIRQWNTWTRMYTQVG